MSNIQPNFSGVWNHYLVANAPSLPNNLFIHPDAQFSMWFNTSEIAPSSNKGLGTKDLFQSQAEVRTASSQMSWPHDIDQEFLIQAEAAFFSFWCWFRLCFLANFRFLRNLGSQPEKSWAHQMVLKCLHLPFMLMCLLVEGFLIPPRWFFLVWKALRQFNPVTMIEAPGCEQCGSWTWPWRFWARDWSETRVWMSDWYGASSLNCHHCVLRGVISQFGVMTSHMVAPGLNRGTRTS